MVIKSTGNFIVSVVQKMIREKSERPAGELVDVWNHRFFKPRGILVVLAKGEVRYSGLGEPLPPSWSAQNMSTNDFASSSSSSSTSMTPRSSNAVVLYQTSTGAIVDRIKKQPKIGRALRGGGSFYNDDVVGDELFRLQILPYN